MALTASSSLPARVAGQTEDEYRNYLRILQGEQQRNAARANGIDTSGQYWDGTQFKDADAGPMKFIGEHPYIGAALALAPAAPFALAAGGPAAVAPAATSAVAPAATGGGSMFGGLTLGDLIKGGSQLTSLFLGNAGNNKALAANAAAQQAALDFAKQQFAQQTATDDARYNAYETRRQPFRAASRDALVQLKMLLGMTR